MLFFLVLFYIYCEDKNFNGIVEEDIILLLSLRGNYILD